MAGRVNVDAALRLIGVWLMRHQRMIRAVQWLVVISYFTLLTLPVLLDLPPRTAHIWNSVTLFAQFVFWGIWWPFVLVSMMLVGRLWCGLLCPEGALAEEVSAYSRGHAIPAWVKWQGWPFVAFAGTTIYGQMISVYQYPKPALAILGFSTVAAVGIAFFYGRNKRVWCRYLCPVTGVFGLLSKLAPVHFRVDTKAWETWRKVPGTSAERFNCAPLVPVRTMRGASACHMCGRCGGFRGAVTLARRSPNHEIVHVAGAEPRPVETLLIVFGLMGLAAGAFHWTGSDLYIAVKQTIAERLVAHDILWPLQGLAPWWILTNYPAQNDVMSPLDGVVLIGYMLGAMVSIGGVIAVLLVVSMRLLGRWSPPRFHHLAQALIPLAGCGVFLGLSSLTVTLLRHDGFVLDFVSPLRAGLLLGAVAWSFWLGWRIAGLYTGSIARRVAAMLPLGLALAVSAGTWASLFWHS
ncbi:MAG: 4Fe-4S binding protein [Xanthobacteraceae bacterium]